MTLHDFLALPHSFRWGGMGGDDCMTLPASWMAEVTGLDPAEGLRGTYRTRDEAHAILAAHRGALAFMAGRLERRGCVRVQAPGDGDIGLVRMMAGETADDVRLTEVGAIRFGPLWASIAPAGIIARRAEMIAAWRLPT